ncbi:MAG: DUF1015 family protein [Saprospiraceae bacterium]
MRIQPFRAVYPNLNYITSAESFFDSVKTDYNEYKDSGFFEKCYQTGVYIYRITKANRHYTGIIACSDIRDFNEGNIKKHEHTLAAKEQKQLQLLLRREAQVKPVLLTYEPVPEVEKWVARNIKKNDIFYEISFEDQSQTHTFWKVSNPKEVDKIQALFAKKIPATYIADGHHRTSTLAILNQRMKKESSDKKYDQLLSAFFPTTELEVLDFNRVIDGLEEVTLSTFMAKLSQVFDIKILTKPSKPKQKYQILMYVNREWFMLTWRKKVLNKIAKNEPEALLDAELLNRIVLRDICDIKDVRTGTQVYYIEGPKGIEGVRRKALKKSDSVGFCLYPVDLKDLMNVADHGRSMPPKSTWFEPRIKNGLIVLEY